MIGERLAELRKLNGETQEDLAKAFHVSVPTVRTWERDKASPSHEVLIALCKRYGTSADYLLGLTDIDPSDEARKQRQRLTEEEQNEMHRYGLAGRLFFVLTQSPELFCLISFSILSVRFVLILSKSFFKSA